MRLRVGLLPALVLCMSGVWYTLLDIQDNLVVLQTDQEHLHEAFSTPSAVARLEALLEQLAREAAAARLRAEEEDDERRIWEADVAEAERAANASTPPSSGEDVDPEVRAEE